MAQYPVSAETGDLFDNFLRSPEPELLVFDCHPEANVYPMVPAGAALSEMVAHSMSPRADCHSAVRGRAAVSFGSN